MWDLIVSIPDHCLYFYFDCLIRPILTYCSEIWICDFNVKESVLDKLPFEKLPYKFCKYLLGVHRRSSNFASRLELGRERILNFITSLALKFNERLSELPADRFLKEVYNVDQAFFEEGYKSWYSFISQSVSQSITFQFHLTACTVTRHLNIFYHATRMIYLLNLNP